MGLLATSRTMNTRTIMSTVVRLTQSRVFGRNSSVWEGNLTVVCRFSRLCWPHRELGGRLGLERPQKREGGGFCSGWFD